MRKKENILVYSQQVQTWVKTFFVFGFIFGFVFIKLYQCYCNMCENGERFACIPWTFHLKACVCSTPEAIQNPQYNCTLPSTKKSYCINLASCNSLCHVLQLTHQCWQHSRPMGSSHMDQCWQKYQKQILKYFWD